MFRVNPGRENPSNSSKISLELFSIVRPTLAYLDKKEDVVEIVGVLVDMEKRSEK